ncbi:NAD-binding protein [Curvibacter sp. APW13]|uniref:potassium channel family protein n=1 Tax=Curvibacter sp. APW13 TaxID=3077236 RepID=UPI0028DF5250|nr:NAD-binding protein [Curvibacter sp. APW13]MDT8991683.1 NAD-binding protein [Curvibacter sp. APW13]
MRKAFRSSHYSGLITGVVLMAVLHLIGTLGYMYIGRPNATWIDSFYMTFITVATIGYGEIVDLNGHPWGRLFTVFIAILGIGNMSYLFSSSVALLLESDLNAALRKKRMQKEIATLRGHYIICGVGRVGSNVANELIKTKREFVVIENSAEMLEQWMAQHPATMHLHSDAAEDEALKYAGVDHAAGVFAVTGDDSHNLMIALSVKLLNPKARVVVRLHDIRNANKAKRAGADEIVSPDFTGGMRIASAMLRPHVVSFMDQMLHSDEGLRMEEVLLPHGAPASTVGELVPRSRDYVLVATHEHGHWVFNPADDHVIKGGTALVLMTTPGGRAHLEHVVNKVTA